jgi:carboxylesterase
MKTGRNGSPEGGGRPVADACLLLHGFCGTPFDLCAVAEALEASGIETASPMLPGHGGTLEEVDAMGFDDWLGAARTAYSDLARGGRRVAVAGFSLGASLALALGTETTPAAVISLAGPLFLFSWWPFVVKDWRLPLVPVLRRLKPIWPNPRRSEVEKELAPWQGTEGGVPMNALDSAMKALSRLRRNLPRLTAPLLVVQDQRDVVVPLGNAFEIVRETRAAVKRLELLNITDERAGRHMIVTHRETRERVAGLAADFLCAAPDGDGRSV